MMNDRVDELEKYYLSLEKRISQLEFRQNLIISQSKVNSLLLDYDITQSQYSDVMDIMDQYRKDIGENKAVNHTTFEQKIYEVIPERDGDYHFCEYISKAFMEDERWEEVFYELYGDMPKYKYLKEDKMK